METNLWLSGRRRQPAERRSHFQEERWPTLRRHLLLGGPARPSAAPASERDKSKCEVCACAPAPARESSECSEQHFCSGNLPATRIVETSKTKTAHFSPSKMVQGGMKCVKYLLFVFNFLFWLAGTAVLAVGLWLRFDPSTKEIFEFDNQPSTFYTGVYILIGAGALMMIVGFLGCCGAIQESTCMLGCFFLFLLVIFAVEIAAGIWGFLNKDKVTEEVQEIYKSLFNEYLQSKDESKKAALIGIQKGLNCCGIGGTLELLIRETCPKAEGFDELTRESCPKVINDMFNTKLYIIGAVGISIGIVMIFGMIFSMVLCCAIRNSREMI